MEQELQDLIKAVISSDADVATALNQYLDSIVWSRLKDEWCSMSEVERGQLIRKLEELK